jgi:hypothetical protein
VSITAALVTTKLGSLPITAQLNSWALLTLTCEFLGDQRVSKLTVYVNSEVQTTTEVQKAALIDDPETNFPFRYIGKAEGKQGFIGNLWSIEILQEV